MLFLNKSYKNRKVSLTIHCKYKYLDSTVQRAEDRRQKFYFCRLPFAVNVKLNLSISREPGTSRKHVTKFPRQVCGLKFVFGREEGGFQVSHILQGFVAFILKHFA